MSDIKQATHFEQRFWLAVLRDHCQFILDALGPSEEKEIAQAQALLQRFTHLADHTPFDLNASQEAAQSLRELKLHLLRRLLTESITFHLPPTFINHMVNEIDEYLRILGCLINNQVPPLEHPLHHHLLWLPDAAGHAEGIQINTDGTEKEFKRKQRYFIKKFEEFYIKAIELTGYLRTQLAHFPALSRFNKEVDLEIRVFQSFLREVEELRLSNKLLGTLAPLMADHMYREECYYLHKLAQVSEIKKPRCRPIEN
ncbi:DUF2935 domain-containing protein [Laceyella sacchari]|uniref:DUF2935 domain-containing protein n=1 Tax=Laceyella sacchari TaxID=37482 RepID=A0ABY5U4L4_LACSH|nr:DUF2935 domain-containing protein [Laceyella sacchari]UWE03212.1 DUF2935 domain-containing protein [Laceyella sacchari]